MTTYKFLFKINNLQHCCICIALPCLVVERDIKKDSYNLLLLKYSLIIIIV